MRKLDIYLKYNSGIFNSKNDKLLAETINILVKKINELIEEVETLKEKQNEPI